MRLLAALALCLAASVEAATTGPVYLKGNTDDTFIGNTSDRLRVEATLSVTGSESTTYVASVQGLVTGAAATDVFTITGSASKTIRVRRIAITATRTTTTTTELVLIKRSTADSGGTLTTPTIVPFDSSNAAATAVVRAYTANPTVGTSIGIFRVEKQFIDTAGLGQSDRISWEWNRLNGIQAPTLRGTSQVLALNLNGSTVSNPSFDIYIEWQEE